MYMILTSSFRTFRSARKELVTLVRICLLVLYVEEGVAVFTVALAPWEKYEPFIPQVQQDNRKSESQFHCNGYNLYTNNSGLSP